MRNNYGFWDQRLMSWELSFWCCLLNIPAACNQSIHWIVKHCYTLLLLVVYSSCLKFSVIGINAKTSSIEMHTACRIPYATYQIVPDRTIVRKVPNESWWIQNDSILTDENLTRQETVRRIRALRSETRFDIILGSKLMILCT